MRDDSTTRPTCQHSRLSHDLHLHTGGLRLSPRLYCVTRARLGSAVFAIAVAVSRMVL